MNFADRPQLGLGTRWQQLDVANYDGEDGFIFMNETLSPNGQIRYVEVKCGRPRLSQARGCTHDGFRRILNIALCSGTSYTESDRGSRLFYTQSDGGENM